MQGPVKLGRYEIKEKIGEGTFGEIYRAEHKLLQREVAIKFIKGDTSERAKKRFFSEARAVASLNHPNVMQIYDFDVSDDNRYYMAMEYFPDGDLNALLSNLRDENRGLTDADAVRILQSVGRGLAFAHAKGILHRDIKPSNVFLAQNTRIVIGDFGLAKGGDQDHTQSLDSGSIKGTPAYLSPEQIEGGPSDARSDIYALGVLTYELLVGRRPYEGGLHTTLMHHLTSPVPDISAVRPDLPPIASTIIQRAMAKSPDDRYPSMDAMLLDLDQLYDELPDHQQSIAVTLASISSSSISMIRPILLPTRPLGRVLQVVTLLVILVAILGGLAFGSTQLQMGDDPTTEAPAAEIDIAPAADGEVLILIAPMRDEALGINIGDLISEQLRTGDLGTELVDDLRVEQLPIGIDESNAAQDVGLQRDAALVIWGQQANAGWTIYVEGIGRSDTAIGDMRLFVPRDDDISIRLVAEVPRATDNYARLLLIHDAVTDYRFFDTMALVNTFRFFDLEAEPSLYGRSFDANVMQAVSDTVTGDFQTGDEAMTQLLTIVPDDLTLITIRWLNSLLLANGNRATRDLERIAALVGEDNELVPAMYVTLYYRLGDTDALLATAAPLATSDTETAVVAQRLAIEHLIYIGDYAAVLELGARYGVNISNNMALYYAIVGDDAAQEQAVLNYRDARYTRRVFDQTILTVVDSTTLHPMIFVDGAFNALVQGNTPTAVIATRIGITTHPNDYMMNWFAGLMSTNAGEYQLAFTRYDTARQNAPFPFPIAPYEQAALLLMYPDDITTDADACELLAEAATQAAEHPEWYAALITDIDQLRGAHCQ